MCPLTEASWQVYIKSEEAHWVARDECLQGIETWRQGENDTSAVRWSCKSISHCLYSAGL